MTGKAFGASKEEREAAKQRMAQAQGSGVSFEDFFAGFQEEHPGTKKATAYGWWQAAAKTPAPKPAKAKSKSSPSEELANLLRKEGTVQKRVVQARAELAAVQADIRRLWQEREKSIEEMLADE